MFPGGDPLPKLKKGGNIRGYKDHAKFVQWTPRKIGIAILCACVPYGLLIVAVVSTTTPIIAIPFIVVPIVLGVAVGMMYWMAKR